MIGLDTNILVRYFLDDDPVWSPTVSLLVEKHLSEDWPGYVNIVTLVELVWILRRQPSYDREKLFQLIMGMANSKVLVLEDANIVKAAAQQFRGGQAGFADYLIAERNAASGATETVTLDRKASMKSPFKHLSQIVKGSDP